MPDRELSLNNLEEEEHNKIFTLNININDSSYSFEIADQTRLLKSINLVKGLNEILGSLNIQKQFYTLGAMDSFGQEVGFFYSDYKKAEQIFSHAKEHNLNVTGHIEQYQVSDGSKDEGSDNI